MHRYVDALRNRDFALLWSGATVSTLGDGMTLVALMWLLYERSHSPVELGWLTFAYTAPVLVGGLVAGVLLDRFDRRLIIALDTGARGLLMISVPLLAAIDALPTWYLFVVAAAYGLLKMVPLAGVPTLIPSLVRPDQVTTANAMESISFGVGGIIGPGLAGILIAAFGAPLVIGIDALTYFIFLICLVAMRPNSIERMDNSRGPAKRRAFGLGPALGVFVASPPILATTLMFMSFNVGEGIFMVVVPIYAIEVLRQDAAAYGAILAAFSGGLLLGAIAVGAIPTPWRLGRAIAAGQALAGATLLGLAVQPALLGALIVGAVFGFVSSPLTIWAQTIRMRIVPAELRGRVFALLRTMMQSTPPIGGLVAGFIIAGPGISAALIVAALVIALPGVVGLLIPALSEEATAKVETATPA